MATLLEGLQRHTVIVAGTGDSGAIACLRPRDATTHPLLIPKAADKPACQPRLKAADMTVDGESAAERRGRVLVAFGLEILRPIDGRVSNHRQMPLPFALPKALPGAAAGATLISPSRERPPVQAALRC